jgi:D-serine deaminase-like pyridoxal phosphate-dependent protein
MPTTYAQYAPSYTWRRVDHWLYESFYDLSIWVNDRETIADLSALKSRGDTTWRAVVEIRGTDVEVSRDRIPTLREAKVWAEHAASFVADAVPGFAHLTADHEARLAPFKEAVRVAVANREAESAVHKEELAQWEADVLASITPPRPAGEE